MTAAAGEQGVLALYLFGSRADDGLRALGGVTVQGAGSDLDVGVVFASPPAPLAMVDLATAGHVTVHLAASTAPASSADSGAGAGKRSLSHACHFAPSSSATAAADSP